MTLSVREYNRPDPSEPGLECGGKGTKWFEEISPNLLTYINIFYTINATQCVDFSRENTFFSIFLCVSCMIMQVTAI